MSEKAYKEPSGLRSARSMSALVILKRTKEAWKVEGELTTAGRCRVQLLLTREEAVKLAEAVRVSGAPSRSLLILESLQAGLDVGNLTGLERRRNCTISFWLPNDVVNETRVTADRLRVSQQSLMRYFLFTYLASAPWDRTRPTHQEPALRITEEEGG